MVKNSASICVAIIANNNTQMFAVGILMSTSINKIIVLINLATLPVNKFLKIFCLCLAPKCLNKK